MREIKFRAWDKKHKMMALVYTLGLTGIEYTTICTDGQLYSGCGKDDIELMQFTGLYDKNGKEIYEGDIVQATFLHHPQGKHEIRWSEGNSGFWAGSTWPVTVEFCKDLKVIGNIYQDSHLLEKPDKKA